MKAKDYALIVTFLLFLMACGDVVDDYSELKADIKKSFFRPDIIYPPDNAYSEESWQLGKLLFYDRRFSLDSSISCASCHKIELAFSDDVNFSKGVGGKPGKRNAPTLANIAHSPYFLREGGVPTLEQQVLVPIQEEVEFFTNILEIERRIKNDSIYNELSQRAYGRKLDYFVITRAISNFERSFISENAAFDKYMRNEAELPLEALKGMEIFYGERGNCAACHSGFNFSDYSFQNNGLYVSYADPGRYRFTEKEEDRALFKVPNLRNISLTAPYMHDGSLISIEAVIDHYSEGIKEHKNKSSLLKNKFFSKEEKKALKAFLMTFTDEAFVNNPKFKEK